MICSMRFQVGLLALTLFPWTTAQQPCDCATATTPAQFVLDNNLGCADPFNEGDTWCYVVGGTACPDATASSHSDTAAWRNCDPAVDVGDGASSGVVIVDPALNPAFILPTEPPTMRA